MNTTYSSAAAFLLLASPPAVAPVLAGHGEPDGTRGSAVMNPAADA